jgi:serine/threonine protein kinase
MSEEAVSNVLETCLSEEDVLAFAAGHLSLTRRRDAHLHFDRCELCQELLNEAVHALATAPPAGFGNGDELVWSTNFRPGTVVGQRYVIRQFIARGGMGEVYEAFDRELQESVALKTVTATACDNPSAVRRLKAEVQLARRVSHPNVCRIYDFGTHVAANGSQVSFLTMELVAGETLGKRLRETGPLPVAEARAIARELLLGLKAAHDAGVLHRDFKSDNVILRKDGQRTQPLILDFGLARALDHQAQQSSASHQGLVGTFAYIAPEQLEGKPFSTASDVYSFGLVWFEMLTGELPFKPSSSPALPALERLTRAVPAPSSKNPLVPPELDAIVLACLRRSTAERLQTAADVLARLDGLGSERPPPAPTPARRRTFAPWAIAAVLAAGAAYLALGSRERTPSVSAGEARPSVAEAPRPSITPVMAATTEARAVEAPEPDAEPPRGPRPSANPTPPTPTPKQKDRETTPAQGGSKPAVGSPKLPADSPEAPVDHVEPPAARQRGWENPFPENG